MTAVLPAHSCLAKTSICWSCRSNMTSGVGFEFAPSSAEVRKIHRVQFGVLSPDEIVSRIARFFTFHDPLLPEPCYWLTMTVNYFKLFWISFSERWFGLAHVFVGLVFEQKSMSVVEILSPLTYENDLPKEDGLL